MDTENWNNYGKFMDGKYHRSNLLYTPKMNTSKDILCMSWDANDPYQLDNGNPRNGFNNELIEYFFSRELMNINIFKNYSWSPDFLEIDTDNKKIFFEWNSETCNDIINKGGKLEEFCPNWKEQLFCILNDIIDSGYYKMSLYPHCFFINKLGILKTFDFYACIEINNPFLKLSRLTGMMGEDSSGRFKEAIDGDSVNFELFFKQAIKSYIKWPEDALNEFYWKKFNE